MKARGYGRVFVLLVVSMAMLVTACGQLKGVHVAGGTAGGFADPNAPGAQLSPGAVATDGTTGAGPGGAGPGGVGPGGGGPGGPGPGGGPVAAGDRTGITAKEIVVGVHAPLTGAAPLEPKAFEAGRDLYWRYLHEKQKKLVHGRRIKVIFADDQYTPSTAVSVCNSMAVNQRAFLLVGAAGTDQINACAAYSDPRGIPYLSPGVQESGLSARRTYFAVTMTYAQQMPLLAEMLRSRVGKEVTNKYGDSKIKIGYVRPNTPNFNDSAEALKKAAAKNGFDYRAFTVSKDGTPTEAQTVATQLEQAGVDVVVPITAPLFTIQLAINTGKNRYKPLYAGVGVSNNINQMINRGCEDGQFENALFTSPWPGWRNVMHREFDPDFRKAVESFPDVEKYNRREKGGDVLLALWGIMKTLHQMLEKAGPAVSRQSFVQTMRGGFGVSLKVFPTLKYAPNRPFGAQDVHVLIGKCRQGGGDYGGDGAQYISHPDMYGLKRSF